jgi:hypothetical protein
MERKHVHLIVELLFHGVSGIAIKGQKEKFTSRTIL